MMTQKVQEVEDYPFLGGKKGFLLSSVTEMT